MFCIEWLQLLSKTASKLSTHIYLFNFFCIRKNYDALKNYCDVNTYVCDQLFLHKPNNPKKIESLVLREISKRRLEFTFSLNHGHNETYKSAIHWNNYLKSYLKLVYKFFRLGSICLLNSHISGLFKALVTPLCLSMLH